jgi:hypothetical protein
MRLILVKIDEYLLIKGLLYINPSGEYDEVYMKLKLGCKGEICVEIGSFHL